MRAVRFVRIAPVFLVAAVACADLPTKSVVPGNMGLVVERQMPGVQVMQIGLGGSAAAAGLRVGDIVLSYNGEAVGDSREFYQLVLDSRPGSVVRLRVLRAGAVHPIDVVIEQLATSPLV